jgi:hypothetical protein
MVSCTNAILGRGEGIAMTSFGVWWVLVCSEGDGLRRICTEVWGGGVECWVLG